MLFVQRKKQALCWIVYAFTPVFGLLSNPNTEIGVSSVLRRDSETFSD